MDDLFSPTNGAGINILRNEIPSVPGETIEPNAPSSPSATPTYTALGADNGQEPFTVDAESYGVNTVIADAWSAPGFMKTNGSYANGGTLCGVPSATCSSGDWRQAYANYIVQYLNDYAADGINVNYVDFENEANLSTSYESMLMTPAQTANFADVLGPTLASSGLPTKMACCDTEGWDYATQYASAIGANSDLALFTSHGYTEAPTSPLSVSRPVWETEWETSSTWDPAWNDGSGASGLTWAEHMWAAFTEAHVSAFFYWWGTRHLTSSTGYNTGLVQLDGATVTPSGRLYAFGQFGRYVKDGARRIAATTTSPNLDVVAFQNPSGSTVLVVINTSGSAQSITVGLKGTGTHRHGRQGRTRSTAVGYTTDASETYAVGASASVSHGKFSSTVPAGAVTTYVIS
jgi:O-glycosyl hydrolase